MKKLLSLLVMTVMCISAWAAELTVADGTATRNDIPVDGYNYDTNNKYTHFIYPADMIADMNGCDITAITFYATQSIGFSGGTQTLYAKIVAETSISSRVTEGLTQVFSGTLVPQGDKLTITFDEPFTYEGGNLLFSMTWADGNYKDASFYGIEQTGASLYSGYSDNLRNFLPKATFTYNDEVADYAARVSNTEVAFGNVPANNLPATHNVKVTNRGNNSITPVVTVNGDAFSANYTATTLAKGESMEIPVAFNAEVAETPYTGTMIIVAFDGEGGTFEIPLSGTVTEPVYEVTVADGTSTSNYFPIYAYYWDDYFHTQTIYNKADLANLAGKEITSLTYYPQSNISLQLNGEATVSIATTTLDYFSGNQNFIETTAVGKWAPNADGSWTINFDTPFAYDGESNIVIDFELTTAGESYASGMFYGKQYSTSDATQTFSLYQYSSSTYSYTSAFVPKVTFGYRDAEVGPQPAEPVITLDIEFGTYETAQVVKATVENMPENGSIKYQFVPATTTSLMAEGDAEWQQYDAEAGITINKSGNLTVAVFNEAGENMAQVSGDYVINTKPTAIETIGGKSVAEVRYYNAAGVASDKAFKGVNIVVTTYADGTKQVTKVVK